MCSAWSLLPADKHNVGHGVVGRYYLQQDGKYRAHKASTRASCHASTLGGTRLAIAHWRFAVNVHDTTRTARQD
jgi:hypothetical protein